MKLKQMLMTILFVTAGFIAWSNVQADEVSQAIARSVNGKQILDVSLNKVPNSDAISVGIKTSEGQRNIIMTSSKLKVALKALQNPQVTGAHNALISSHIIHKNPSLMRVISKPSQPAKVAKPVAPNAPAVTTSAITSANQQASK